MDGIEIQGGGATSNQVQGNYIGTNATGTASLGNGNNGVLISGAPNNTIGGTASGAGNVISGNVGDGVQINASGATGNQVLGNYIGTNAAGTASLGNGNSGVFIFGAPSNTIGGAASGARNVISGNGFAGVRIHLGSGNQVLGNYIGTNAAGTASLGNGFYGVFIDNAPNNTIGGTASGAGNVISGNLVSGVEISGSSATMNQVLGNYIGTNAAGTASLANGSNGVRIIGSASSNTIGGTASGAGNVISGNSGDGVEINGSNTTGNQVQGNFIGTQIDGTSPLGNTSHGVFITNSASNNTIGGTTAGAGNTLAFNGGDGVFVSSGTGNRIDPNSIHDNTGLGIDLGADGVTPNDNPMGNQDADAGANNLQNFPDLGSATVSGGMLTIRYAVTSTTTNSTYPIVVEFFKADAGGEGQTFLGSDTYTAADRTMNFVKTITFTPAAAVMNGDSITATATDTSGNTSEFTSPVVVVGAPTAVEVSSFTAQVTGGGVMLQWETVSEVDLVGFNVLRSADRGQTYRQRNATLIVARSGGSPRGGRYEFRDEAVPRVGSYWYVLELVRPDGRRERVGPIEVRLGRRVEVERAAVPPDH